MLYLNDFNIVEIVDNSCKDTETNVSSNFFHNDLSLRGDFLTEADAAVRFYLSSFRNTLVYFYGVQHAANSSFTHIPTGPFENLEAQNQAIGEFYLVQERRSIEFDFEIVISGRWHAQQYCARRPKKKCNVVQKQKCSRSTCSATEKIPWSFCNWDNSLSQPTCVRASKDMCGQKLAMVSQYFWMSITTLPLFCSGRLDEVVT